MSFPSPKEFFEKYKDDPDKAKKSAFEMGREFGNALKQELEDPKSDLETVALVMNIFQKKVQGEPTAKVDGDKVVMVCGGFCPVMRAAMTLSLPWKWLDENLAWPMIEGIASTVIQDIDLDVISTKSRGDSQCVYVFSR